MNGLDCFVFGDMVAELFGAIDGVIKLVYIIIGVFDAVCLYRQPKETEDAHLHSYYGGAAL